MAQDANNVEEVTRICVKNVPPYFTESKLRSHLVSNAQNPLTITDCKILRTKDGVSRKIAFVGFKTSEMAQYAISYFDKSFAATSRLSVEAAFAAKSNQSDFRPWSKHSKGSSRFDGKHEEEGTENKKAAYVKGVQKDVANDGNAEITRKKQEFVDVMLGGGKGKTHGFWANDDMHTTATNEKIERENESSSDGDSDDDSDSDEESVDVMKSYKQDVTDMEFLRSKVLSNKENFSDDELENGDLEEQESRNKNQDNDISDDDHSSTDFKDNNSVAMMDLGAGDGVETTNDNAAKKSEITAARLFIRNLPFSATEEEVRNFFSSYGTIVECHIPVDDTNRNKGYAFVKFSSNAEASAAMDSLDGTAFQGRLVHIIPAKEEARTNPDENETGKQLTHKQKKELERQKSADNMKGWNASFIRGDAVVDNLASRLGIEKGSILNVKDDLTAGNAAVRVALGETQVIEENRKYFQKHGIDMDSLVAANTHEAKIGQRSSNMILVKNLPFDTSLEELSKVFVAANGKRPQILLPPSRTVALIIFANNSDAKKAFRKTAYKRFKNVPLYLEWASTTISNNIDDTSAPGDTTIENKMVDKAAGNEDDLIDDDEYFSIYVKNLNFRTTEDTLKGFFEEEVGNVRSVRIPTRVSAIKSVRGLKPSTDAEPKRQSMGFGFVEFTSQASAKKALSLLQGKVIDGHEIELSMSKSKAPSGSKLTNAKSKMGTKIIVRNVPFQASRTDILQLFGSFGHLKTVRLPKKYDGGHRGFAFVEFASSQEASSAMKTLASTHLYGRHLVLEWASDSSDIESLRDKTKRESAATGLLGTSRNKKIRTE